MKYSPIDSLPTTRAFLHFEATRTSDHEVRVDYELVIPLTEADCRGTFDRKGRKTRPKNYRAVWLDASNNKRIPLGRTLIGTENKDYPFNPFFPKEIDLPFRDSAHLAWDNERLGGLQVFYSMGGKGSVLI